jgi:hypothetical protein
MKCGRLAVSIDRPVSRFSSMRRSGEDPNEAAGRIMSPDGIVRHGLILVVLLADLARASALAQSQNSAIAGVVRDMAGNRLSGVTVEASSPSSTEGRRTVTTDSRKQYKIAELRPGPYHLTFGLDGHNAIEWQGLELISSFTTTVDVQMQRGSAREKRVGPGPVAVVDTQNVAQTAVTSRQIMDALPTDRSFISFAALKPGMQVVGAVQNVGGSIPENALMLQVHGSRIGETRLFVDGMSVMSGNGTGGLNLGNFVNNAMAQEVVVNTGAMSAEFEVAGVASNLIVRDGSDIPLGSFSGRYMTSALQGENLDADLVARGLRSGNRIQKIWDANPAAGVPLVKRRAWLFSSFRHWGTYNYVAGLFADLDPSALFYTPDLGRPAIQPVWHASGDARLTVRATSRNKVTASYHHQYSDFGTCLNPTRLTAPSACPHNVNDPQWFAQASWTSPLTRRLLAEAGATTTTVSTRSDAGSLIRAPCRRSPTPLPVSRGAHHPAASAARATTSPTTARPSPT